MADLNKLYNSHPSWAETDHISDKFEWVDCNDASNQTLSFLRFGNQIPDTLLIACNFSDQIRNREWGCQHPGIWRVILDTDGTDYAGYGSAGSTEFQAYEGPVNQKAYGPLFRSLNGVHESYPQQRFKVVQSQKTVKAQIIYNFLVPLLQIMKFQINVFDA